jgi:HEAT repeat protein
MLRQPAALVLLLLLAASDYALAHGGTLRGRDGTATPQFGGPACGPPTRPVVRQRHPPDFTHDWDWWWDNNAGLHLAARARVAREAAVSRRSETEWPDPAGTFNATVVRLTRSQIRGGVLPVLHLGLSDPYFDCRAASVIALGKVAAPGIPTFGPEVFAGMRKLRADPDRGVRESAHLALGLVGDPSEALELLLFLEDDPRARALAGMGTKSILRSERAFAAVGLGLIGMRAGLDDAAVSRMVARVETDDDQGVRALTAMALGAVRSRSAVPRLRTLATSATEDPVVRAHVIVALAKLGDRELLDWLVKSALRERSNDVARSSAIALGLLARQGDVEAVDTLILHAKSAADRSVRNFSLIALGQVGGEKPVEFLLDRLIKGQPHDRTFAALALGLRGRSSPELKPKIAEGLLECWSEVKAHHDLGAYAIGLGLLEWKPAAPSLIEALKAEPFGLKGHLATALALLGASEAAPLVRKVALGTGAPDSPSTASARRALGLFGEANDVEVSIDLIRQDGHDLSALGGAAEGLGFNVDKRAVSPLTDVLSKPDSFKDTARAFAAVALGCLGDKDEIPLLVQLRSHCNYLASTDALRELLRIY